MRFPLLLRTCQRLRAILLLTAVMSRMLPLTTACCFCSPGALCGDADDTCRHGGQIERDPGRHSRGCHYDHLCSQCALSVRSSYICQHPFKPHVHLSAAHRSKVLPCCCPLLGFSCCDTCSPTKCHRRIILSAERRCELSTQCVDLCCITWVVIRLARRSSATSLALNQHAGV